MRARTAPGYVDTVRRAEEADLNSGLSREQGRTCPPWLIRMVGNHGHRFRTGASLLRMGTSGPDASIWPPPYFRRSICVPRRFERMRCSVDWILRDYALF
jgi:hypothetical protein